MKLQYLGKTKIHVTFGDVKHKLYVSRYSTCDDVIHAILDKQSTTTIKSTTFGLFEQSGGVDRMLAGSTRVLKIIRSWGCESSKFELILKRKSAVLDLKREFQHNKDNAESFVDELYTKQMMVKKNLRHQGENHLEPKTNRHILPVYASDSRLNLSRKQDKLKSGNRPRDKTTGKSALLSRYISDVFLYNNKQKRLSKRKAGDGTENPKIESSRDSADGSSILLEVCRKSWELDRDTDQESDVDSLCDDTYIIEADQSVDYSTDDDDDDYDDDDDHLISNLDVAFVKSAGDSDSDEGIDVTSVNSGDLNTAFVGEYESGLDLNSESESEYSYDVSTDDETGDFTANKTCEQEDINNLIQKMFDKPDGQSEDEEMDSFMVSRLDF